MIVTVQVHNDNLSQELFISYENYAWKLAQLGEIERFLPLSLDYDLHLKNENTQFDFRYEKITPKMQDYYWILLMKVLDGEVRGFSLTNEQQKNAVSALNDFFTAVMQEVEMGTNSQKDTLFDFILQ